MITATLRFNIVYLILGLVVTPLFILLGQAVRRVEVIGIDLFMMALAELDSIVDQGA